MRNFHQELARGDVPFPEAPSMRDTNHKEDSVIESSLGSKLCTYLFDLELL